MSKEVGKELEEVPSCLAKRYKILEKLVKDISASTASATDAPECEHDCKAKKVCSLLKVCHGSAGPSENPLSQKMSCSASPEKKMSSRPPSYPPQMPQPMQQLSQAADCTCKPGSRIEKTIEQDNKMSYKKKISYMDGHRSQMDRSMEDGHRSQMDRSMEVDDYKRFGEAIAAELTKRNAYQANLLKQQITKAILELDEGGTKSIDAGAYPKYVSQYENRDIQPSSDLAKYDDYVRTSTAQSVQGIESVTPIMSEPNQKRLNSVPFYASKSQVFQYDRKEEFGSKELVLEVESSLSVDVNDTGEELVEWPSHGNVAEEPVPGNVLDEVKKEVEEKLKEKKE